MSAFKPLTEILVSEPIELEEGLFDRSAMAAGEPGLPLFFSCRGQRCRVAEVLDRWKESGPCRNASSTRAGRTEKYLRRHWYRVLTADGRTLTLYFNRQPRRGQRGPRARWVLYSMSLPVETTSDHPG